MRLSLLETMTCPYCLGTLRPAKTTVIEQDRLRWGTVSCRCFEFPIVNGVLLLSLAKGYGGSEESLAPYVPLQVAALDYLGKNDLLGLRAWIERHIPLIAQLIDPSPVYYLDFMALLNAQLAPKIERDLWQWSRYEVLGRAGALRQNPPQSAGKRVLRNLLATRAGAELLSARSALSPPLFESFYVSRFVGKQLVALRALLHALPMKGPLLSLCQGHGVFELLVTAMAPQSEIVSIDGQLINLFVTQRFVNPAGDYICHDVQFDLPFGAARFAGTFSSSCLGEIPSQASFIREAVRVTEKGGWTVFDSVETNDPRVLPMRYYRFCQNHFEKLEEYGALMSEMSAGRLVSFVLDGEQIFHVDIDALRTHKHCSFVIGPKLASLNDASPFTAGERARLSINPTYEAAKSDRTIDARLRRDLRWKAWLHPDQFRERKETLELDRTRLVDEAYLKELYHAGTLVLLPEAFARDATRVHD